MAKIISCSRRTDLPAFYAPWFINRLRAGYCHTTNPFGGQVYRVSLRPEDVVAIIFWTRNPAPLFPYLDELDGHGYRYYFNQTLTSYPDGFETHNPSEQVALNAFRRLSERLSPWRMQWRYDPIILSSLTPPEYHLERFSALARSLEGYTEHCTFSFIDYYGKTRRNLGQVARQQKIEFFQPELEEQQDLARQLGTIARAHGIRLYSCCNDALTGSGVEKNRCIDPEIVRRLAPEQEAIPSFRPTRQDCGCLASVDIGAYDTCLFGCSYCYATNSRQAALQRRAAHDPDDSLLYRPAALAGKDLDALSVPLKS